MSSFSVNVKDFKKLEDDLDKLGPRAVPFATRDALNKAAFAAMRIAKRTVTAHMVMRNRFTVNSIQVDKARSLTIRNQVSTVGSTAPYMETQEFGGTVTSRGSEGVAIPTSYASGEGLVARPRKRLPRRPNRVGNITLNRGRLKGSRKARNAAAIAQALKSGTRYVFLRLQRVRGIFKLVGGKKNPRIKMVADMSRPSVRVPRFKWLAPSMVTAQKMMPGLYVESLKFQLKRLGMFKG